MDIPITRKWQQQQGQQQQESQYGREQFGAPEKSKSEYGRDQFGSQYAPEKSKSEYGREQFGGQYAPEKSKSEYGREQFGGQYAPEKEQFGQKEQIGREKEQFGQKDQFGREKEQFGQKEQIGREKEQFGQKDQFGREKESQFGRGELGREYKESQIGQLKEVQLKVNDIGAADLDHLMCALKFEGLCYIKNHLFIQLTGDPGNHIRNWQRNVTKKNLDSLIELVHECGLSLPFCCKLEDREQEIKSKLQGAGLQGVLSEGETLMILKSGAVYLQSLYTCGFMCAHNDKFRNICRNACSNVSSEFLDVANALKSTSEHYPPPMIKTCVEKVGVWERR